MKTFTLFLCLAAPAWIVGQYSSDAATVIRAQTRATSIEQVVPRHIRPHKKKKVVADTTKLNPDHMPIARDRHPANMPIMTTDTARLR